MVLMKLISPSVMEGYLVVMKWIPDDTSGIEATTSVTLVDWMTFSPYLLTVCS